MRKIFFLFAIFLGTIIVGCNPMEDLHDEAKANNPGVVEEVELTLTDDDYDELELSFGSFSSEDDAKLLLPDFLADKYPYLSDGSSVKVGYDLFIGRAEGVSDYTDEDDHYFLSDADYALSGSDVSGFYPDVDASDYLVDILTTNIVDPVDGQVALARYVQYTETPMISITTNYSLEDNLDYGGAAGDLTAVSAGDWEAHSGAGSGPIGYDTSSLSMTDYPSSDIGGSLTVDGANSEDVTNWFTEIESGTVYASTLVNLSAVSTGTYTFHLRDESFGFRARVGAMDDGFGKVLFGIGADSSTLTYGTTAFDLNTTYLLVSSYDFGTGDSNLYVLSTAEATEPATAEATDITGTPGTLISGVSIRQGFGGPTGTFDGIRVATSWDAIMTNDTAEIVEGDKMKTEIFYTYSGGDWDATEGVYFMQDADFDSMGEGSGQPGRFNNFGSSTPPDDYLPTFLSQSSPWAYGLEEDEIIMVYDYFSSSSGAQIRGDRYTVIDGMWVGHESVIATTLQFGLEDGVWLPDNTIRYTFTEENYTFAGETLENEPGFENAASNLLNFGNFNRQGGASGWSDDMMFTAVSIVLDNINPSAADGQKYIVSVAVYNGSNAIENYSLIKTEGEWVAN